MKRFTYMKRVAKYSIVSGTLSLIGNNAEIINGDLSVAAILIPIMMIISGFLLISNIKKGSVPNIHSKFLSLLWLSLSFFSFFLIFSNLLLFIVLVLFLAFPLYNLYKFYVIPKDIKDWF